MVKRLLNFRFKAWHFVLLLATLFLVTNIVGNIQVDKESLSVSEPFLIELDKESLAENISSGSNFVFFYSDNDNLSAQMEYNLNRLAQEKGGNICFYKLNIDENIDLHDKYNISGVPNILIFEDGKEVNRVMGVVPVSNLRMIYNRISEKEEN